MATSELFIVNPGASLALILFFVAKDYPKFYIWMEREVRLAKASLSARLGFEPLYGWFES